MPLSRAVWRSNSFASPSGASFSAMEISQSASCNALVSTSPICSTCQPHGVERGEQGGAGQRGADVAVGLAHAVLGEHGQQVRHLVGPLGFRVPLGEAEPRTERAGLRQGASEQVGRREVPGAVGEHDEVVAGADVVGERVGLVPHLDAVAERTVEQVPRGVADGDRGAVTGWRDVGADDPPVWTDEVREHGGHVSLAAADLQHSRAVGDLPGSRQLQAVRGLRDLNVRADGVGRHEAGDFLGIHRGGA